MPRNKSARKQVVQPDQHVQNAAKTLLANIRFMSVDNPYQLISLTSSVPNEGKTFVTASLGQAIATSGKTCLAWWWSATCAAAAWRACWACTRSTASTPS